DTVVEEGGLARNISVLRKALGEKPDDHQYIVTAPGQGYRFVADVKVQPDTGDPAGELARMNAGAERPRTSTHWAAATALAVFVVAGIAYALRPTTEVTAIDPVRPRIASIAVLPLDNLSGHPEQ